MLKLGFIGGGNNSAVGAAHFFAAQADGRFKVEAGCFSRHEEINRETAKHWNIPAERCYSTVSELLASEKGKLDAVVVLTPTPLHREQVSEALRLGYPVICEKALATSSAEAQEIQQTIQQTNGFLVVTYNYTGYPMLRELKHMIESGRLGRIEQVHIEMPQEGFAKLGKDGQPIVPQQWRLRDGTIPTISLDLGVHVHHLVHFLTGETIQELVALQSSQGRFRQVVDNTMCIARYSHGMDSWIWFSKAALGYRNGLRIRVFGENASVEWYQMEPENLIFCDNHGQRRTIDRGDADINIANLARYNRFKAGHPSGFLEAFGNLYGDIADALQEYLDTGLQGDSQYTFGVEQALDGLNVLEAMASSSEGKVWKTI